MTDKENDLYTRVTDKIIADLEKGQLIWRQPWNASHLAGRIMRPLRWEGTPYTGINILMLWMTATDQGYVSPYWMTYKQALDMGAHVRRGEHATTTVYANSLVKEEQEADGTVNTHEVHYLKQYSVFNAGQIEGLPETYYKLPEPPQVNPEQRVEMLEKFFRQTKAEITTGVRAVYLRGQDRIQMPPFESFADAVSYYATLSHELTHWTGHPSRLNREFGRTFGDERYAKEELVAELGACFLAADLGFEPVTREEHAAYLQSWLKVLQGDKRFIFHAAALAQRAVEFVKGLQPEATTTPARVLLPATPAIPARAPAMKPQGPNNTPKPRL